MAELCLQGTGCGLHHASWTAEPWKELRDWRDRQTDREVESWHPCSLGLPPEGHWGRQGDGLPQAPAVLHTWSVLAPCLCFSESILRNPHSTPLMQRSPPFYEDEMLIPMAEEQSRDSIAEPACLGGHLAANISGIPGRRPFPPPQSPPEDRRTGNIS